MKTTLANQSSSQRITWLKNPIFRVVSTWIWWMVGAVLTLLIITLLLGETAVVTNPATCNYCAECEAICPVDAIALPYQIVQMAL